MESFREADHPSPLWLTGAAAGLIVLAGLSSFHNSLSLPFLFDDVQAIKDNATIRKLWPIGEVLWPASAKVSGATGRPLANLSFAINYALGGLDVRGYHAFNLAVHICAALILFGLVRRTIRRWPAIEGRKTSIATAIALIWVVHPLQTESVTYITSRTESLMGLFYLLTLYCYVRSALAEASTLAKASADRSGEGILWGCLSIFACLLGMLTKEVMVTAPLLALLYDRTFLAGSLGQAWRRRGWLLAGLGATWLRLVYLILSEHGARGTTAGFGLGVTWSNYALTQCWAVVHYLRLALWPNPLLFDYGTEPLIKAREVAPQALLLGILALGTVWLLFRPVRLDQGFRFRRGFAGRVGGRALGFAGAWFFLILAPSSSVYPLPTELIAEHRMYLPLAAIVALFVIGLVAWGGNRGLLACLGLVVVLGWLTVRRNAEYGRPVEFWGEAVARIPRNPRARDNLGVALAGEGRLAEATAQYRLALSEAPAFYEAHDHLGQALDRMGRTADAIEQYRKELALKPESVTGHNNLANALRREGKLPEAIEHLHRALAAEPDNPEAYNNLGVALLESGDAVRAEEHFRRALALQPAFPEAEFNLGNTARDEGRLDEAIGHYQAALRLDPRFAEADNSFGAILLATGHRASAVTFYEKALRLNPGYAEAHCNLGMALRGLGRTSEAIAHYREALRLRPNYAEAHNNLGNALAGEGRKEEAISEYEEALRLRPDYADALRNLALARKAMGLPFQP